MAKLYFRYGAMSSGKSAYMLQAAHNYEESGRSILLAKPDVDTKSGDSVSSRIGISRKIDFIIHADTNIFSTFNELNQQHMENNGQPIACLLVDEAQFLKKEQVDQLLKITALLNVPVMCFGIRTDFTTKGFEGSNRLLQIAHSIEEMKTICASCGKGKATLNARKINGEYVFDGAQVAIDVASDTVKKQKTVVSYESLCSGCYLKFSEGKLGD
jgi:thymidine kinase